MRKNRHLLTLLLLGILGFILLTFLVISYPPQQMIPIFSISIPMTIPFFIIFFLTLFGFSGFFFKRAIQGVVIGFFLTTFLFLRFFQLTHWFFLLLLIILFVIVEIVLHSDKKEARKI